MSQVPHYWTYEATPAGEEIDTCRTCSVRQVHRPDEHGVVRLYVLWYTRGTVLSRLCEVCGNEVWELAVYRRADPLEILAEGEIP